VRVEAALDNPRRLFADSLPKAAVQRANAALPQPSLSDEQMAPTSDFGVQIEPYFAPFDRFLTRFDLRFANCLASAFGRKAYLPLPLRRN
jgi:tRNA(Ile)-lysidine synthase